MLLFDDKMQQYPGRPSRRGVSRNFPLDGKCLKVLLSPLPQGRE